MNKKVSIGAAIAFALLVAAAVFSITGIYTQRSDNQMLTALTARQTQYSKFAEIDDAVRPNYYGTIVETQLQDSIAEGYMKGIGDPNATYYSAEKYALANQDETKTSASIGTAQRTNPDGYIEITEVYPDSPAELSGISPGTLIIKMDDVEINKENNADKIAQLNGSEGSQISLVLRSAAGEQRTVDLVRRIVSTPTITWQFVPDTKIAYIRIISFDKTTSNQFSRYYQDMLTAGANAMIIDLRDNVGYELEYATRIMDRILPKANMATVVYNDGVEVQYDASDDNRIAWPITIITNEKTTGTAEMFAQTLKEHLNVKIVGAATAGRGVRLEVTELSDGSALEFTVAVYKSPHGIILNGEGISPDYNVTLQEENWQSLGISNDPQIIKAIEVIKGLSQ